MSLLNVDPTDKITDDCIPTGANLNHAKLQHRKTLVFATVEGTSVTAQTQIVLPAAYKASTVLAASAQISTLPSSGNRTCIVDVCKSTGGSTYTSILTGTTSFTSGSTVRTPGALSLSGTPTLIANDILEVVVTTGGTSGDNAQGLGVVVTLAENGA